eukprot:4197385-Prorocentrum_lima.AAC.1
MPVLFRPSPHSLPGSPAQVHPAQHRHCQTPPLVRLPTPPTPDSQLQTTPSPSKGPSGSNGDCI